MECVLSVNDGRDRCSPAGASLTAEPVSEGRPWRPTCRWVRAVGDSERAGGEQPAGGCQPTPSDAFQGRRLRAQAAGGRTELAIRSSHRKASRVWRQPAAG